MIEVDTREVERMALRLRGLALQIAQPAGIMRTVAEGVEEQTRARIFFEKRAPDGTRWRPWSEAYRRTRRAHHSLLIDTRDMVDGLDHTSTATTAITFSRQPYAAAVGAIRPFFGLSAENTRDIEGWLAPALEGMAADALRGV